MSITIDENTLDAFTRAYIRCAFWISTIETENDNNSEPLDENYTPDDLAPEALKQMVEDCKSFQERFQCSLKSCEESDMECYAERAGHDFWLTRNHHGAGFSDGWPAPYDQILTDGAHAYGSADLYVGDDGKVYHS